MLQAKPSVPRRHSSRCGMQPFEGREAARAFGIKVQLSSHVSTSPSVTVMKTQLREAATFEEKIQITSLNLGPQDVRTLTPVSYPCK